MYRRVYWFAAVLLLSLACQARASITVSIDNNLTIASGQSGLMSVYISGDGSSAIDSFSFRLQITSVGSGPFNLSFAPELEQPLFPFASPALPDLPYVFAGRSVGEEQGWHTGITSDNPFPNDTLDGLDFTNDSSVAEINPTRQLLIQFRVQHTPSQNASYPEQYTVSIDPVTAFGSYRRNEISGEFVPDNTIGYTVESAGIVTVNAAVPEPTACLVWTILGLAGLGYRRWHRRPH